MAQWVLGGVERRNPLPVGTYWVDIPREKHEAFKGWLSRHRATVRVLRTHEHAPGWSQRHSPTREEQRAPGAYWYLFLVSAPTPWEGPGFPTIATPQTKPEDTAQVPAPSPSSTDTFASISAALASIPPLVLLAALYLLTRKN